MDKKHDHKQIEEDCPLCQTSKEAIDKLKLTDNSSNESEKDRGDKEKKSKSTRNTRNIRMVFIGLVIILGVFVIYKSLTNSIQEPLEENSSVQATVETQPANVVPGNSKLPQINQSASDFYAYDTVGNKITLSDFRGDKSILLVFWATWCGYCAKELPDLKTFTQENKDKIKVLVVASGEIKEVVKDYIKEHDINFTMLLDEERKIWNLYGVRGTPAHFLIGLDGNVITMRPGLAVMSDLKIMLSMLR